MKTHTNDRVVAVWLYLFLMGSVPAMAGPGDVDPGFVVGDGFTDPPQGNGAVNAVTLQPDGKIIAGGTFTQYQGNSALRITRLQTNGDLDTAFVARQGTGLDSEVNDILVLPDDRILICGDFLTDNGTNVSGIARLNANGSLDTTFNSGGAGIGGVPLRYGYKMVRQPDGKIIVAGGFNSFNGVGRNSIARLNADGSLDTTFNPGSGPYTESPYSTTYGVIDCIDLQPDGKIVVAGAFTLWNWDSAPKVVRLNSNGTLDTTFLAEVDDAYRVSSCLVEQDGTILLGGRFGEAGSDEFLVRLNSDGSLDSTFTAETDGAVFTTSQRYDGTLLVGGIYRDYAGSTRGSLARADRNGTIDSGFVTTPHTAGAGYNTQVYDTAVQPDGKIIVGGLFTNFNGQAYNNMVRLEGDPLSGAGNIRFTTSNYTVNEGVGTATVTVIREGGSDGAVQVGVGMADFEALAGSDYDAYSGTIDWADGEHGPKTFTVDITDDANAEMNERLTLGVSILSGSAVVNSGDGGATLTIVDNDSPPVITEDPANQSMYISGTAVFDVRVSSGLPVTYRWLFNGGAIAGGLLQTYTVSDVDAGDAGDYSVIVDNGISAVTSSVAVLTVYEPAGTLDLTWAPAGGGPSATVNALALQSDGKLLVGGDFTKFNYSTQNRICRLNPNGTLDPVVGQSGGCNGSVFEFAIRDNGTFIAGGAFSSYNYVYRQYVAQILSTGTLDLSWSGGTFQALAYAFSLQSDGKLLVGHSHGGGVQRYHVTGSNDSSWSNVVPLNNVNGLIALPGGKVLVAGYTFDFPTTTAGLYRLKADGTMDSTFNHKTNLDGNLLEGSLAVQADGKILIAYGHDSTYQIVRYHPDGTEDTGFDSGMINNSIFRILATEDGKVLASGLFSDVDGTSVGGMVRLNGDGSVDDSFYAGSGANGTIHDMVIAPDGSIYVGGTFFTFNGIPRKHIAKLSGGPGSVQYEYPVYQVIEDQGLIVVGVERVAGSMGAVSADYVLTAGSASTSDYTSVTGTVSWADGEMGAKTFSVPIAADALAEDDETVFLSLENLTGGVAAGVDSSVVLTIQDDDSPPLIVEQPTSLSSPEEVEAEFRMVASSPHVISYQWKYNGANLPGETNASYTIANVQTNHAGLYSVRVTNLHGFRDSDVVELEVYPSPTRLDEAFTSLLNGTVRAVLPLGDGRALVGGDFTSPRNKVALLNADGTVDGSFTLEVGAAGSVHALERDVRGRILVGGDFVQVGGGSYSNLLRLNQDFSIDTIFNLNLGDGPDGLVRAISVMPSGSILVGGDFDSVSCRLGTDNLAKLEESGRVDTNFISRAHGSVYRIVPHVDGKAYLAGSFYSYDASPNNYLVRILPDGKADPAFSASLNNAAYALDVQADGKLVVGGAFSQRILRVDDTGAADHDFAAGVIVNDTVWDVAVQPNQRIVAVGRFTTFGTAHNRFVRLDADGSVDETISIGSGFTSSDAYCAALEPGGAIWVGGAFSYYKGSNENHLARLHGDPVLLAIGVQPLDAAVAPGASAQFNVVAAGEAPFGYQWYGNGQPIPGATGSSLSTTNAGSYDVVVTNASGSVTSRTATLEILGAPVIIQHPVGGYVGNGMSFDLIGMAKGAPSLNHYWLRDGSVVGGGYQFDVLSASPTDAGDYQLVAENGYGSGTSLVAKVIVHDPPTDMDALFPPLAGTPDFHQILGIIPLPDQRVLVGGTFFQMKDGTDATIARDYLGLFKPDGTVDAFDAALNNTVLAIERQRDGKILVAGSFTSSFGQSTNNYLIRLNADLTYDAPFSANLGTGPDSIVRDIELQDDGRILISGEFSAVDGQPGTRSVARLRSDGRVDPSFTSEVVNFSGIIQVKQQPDGKLLICGFPFVYGSESGVMHRLNADGSRDATFSVDLNIQPVEMIPMADGRILIGGGFSIVNGVSRDSLVRLESDGSLDETYLQGIEINGNVASLAMQPDGCLLAGGNFSVFGTARNHIVRINPDGTIDQSFTAHRGFEGHDQRVYDIAPLADGRIWVSGSFETYDKVPVNNFVLLQGNAIPLAFASQPFDVVTMPSNTVEFSAVAVGDPTITYQWFKGTNAIAGEIGALLQLTNVTVADNGTYRLRSTNGSGSVDSLPAMLTVLDAPVITEQPVGGTFLSDGDFSLYVEALGIGPLIYQWLKGGLPIADATNSSFSVNLPTETDAGDYQVVVSGALAPAATSQVAQVDILLPPGGFAGGFPMTAGVGSYEQLKVIRPLSGGRVAIGGYFTSAGQNGNNTAVGHFALLNTNGTVDVTHSPSFNAEVKTIEEDGSGGLLIGGSFSGATAANGPLVHDFPNGSFDAAFGAKLGAGIRSAWGFGSVNDLKVLPSGKLLIAGFFDTVDGHASPGVALLNSDGSVDTGFVSGLDIYSRAKQLFVLSDGSFYAPGYMPVSGGRKGIRRWTAAGAIDGAFDCATADELTTMALLPDGRVVGSAANYMVGGVSTWLNMAILNDDGSVDESFTSGSVVNFTVQALDVQSDGKLLIGSSTYNQYDVIRLNTDSSLDTTFDVGSGADGIIYEITVQDDGKIWVGGAFGMFNGQTVNGLVLLNGSPPAPASGILYADWALANGLTPGVNDDPEDDADGDGLENMAEFAFGSHPNQIGDAAWPELSIVDVGGTNYLAVVYTRNADAVGVNIEVEGTDDLVGGNSIGTTVVSTADLGGGLEQVTVRLNTSVADLPEAFLEVKTVFP